MSDNPIYSDFWLEQETYSNYIDTSSENPDGAFSIDLIQLASVRRIISNYVDILTGITIPVYFKSVGESYNIGGKEIYITTAIKRRKDFDQAVGLALHEAAHTVLTDFDLAKTIPFNTPKLIWDFCKKNNIRRITMERFLKTMFNIVEDWYIDDWVISRVPGYIGYYEESYNVCFNTSVIDQLLLSNDYRHPSLTSYEFRIVNFTNPLTDLMSLPGLEDIAKTINISSISRLTNTSQRIAVSFKVVEIVLKNLQLYHDKSIPTPSPSSQNKRIDVNSFFKDTRPNANEKKNKEKSDSDRTMQDIANALAQRPKDIDDENKSATSQTSKSADKELPKEVKQSVDKQIHYVHGNTSKQELGDLQKKMLDLIEKHGIELVYVPVTMSGNDATLRIGCVVVKKLTMELIEAGKEVFPMVNAWKDGDGNIRPDNAMAEAVQKGILLGNKLGRKLIIRRESNRNKEIRKRYGKINKQLIYSAGFDSEDIFEKINISKYSKGSLHITVDASTSMVGKKWNDTITMCVAVCKATSMVDNIHVTVSFRATKTVSGVEMPYVVQAYDSQVDKFSKVKNLFQYLCPCGCTPEGLAFHAIMNLFTKAAPDEEDRYFLNISDGEPYFAMKSPLTGQIFNYVDENGVEHTKNQVNKIRRQGIHILSYYIQDETCNSWIGDGHNTKKNFQLMYGRDARFLDINSVTALATSINELFLKE
jgi:hypothetical protein